MPTRAVPVPSGRRQKGILPWVGYYLREAVAIPVDTVLALLPEDRGPPSAP